MKHPVVEVEYIDASASHGWGDYAESDLHCRTVGFLVEEREDRLVLSDTYSLDGNTKKWRCILEVPKVAIISWRVLRVRGAD